MASNLAQDPRIDPRINAMFGQMGTVHGADVFAGGCPNISPDTASVLANFARR